MSRERAFRKFSGVCAFKPLRLLVRAVPGLGLLTCGTKVLTIGSHTPLDVNVNASRRSGLLERRTTTKSPSAGTHTVPQDADVLRQLRSAITQGEFAPGQRLIEADLCSQYEASRFVVRTALQLLAAEGLVEMERNKGARVRAVPLDEALEVVEVRTVLEGLAAARAAARATAADVAELREIGAQMRLAVEQADVMAYGELNSRLHDTIQRISANATCMRTLQRLRGQIVRHQFALTLQSGRPAVSLAEHERVIAAIAAHDQSAAETAMRAHLGSVMEAMRANPAGRRPG